MPISSKLDRFGTTIFSEMTKLAIEHGAINLSQGFPDFDGPPEMIEAVTSAMREGHNQYARSMGHPELVTALADRQRALYGLEYDAMSELVVTSGATEAIASSLLALLDPGDEVILIEPFYDSYPACAAMTGAIPRHLTLRFPGFAVDPDELRSLFNERTRVLVLNTPHNPTGKVYSREELSRIAALCIEHDVVVISDEVYEHLTYDGAEHVPIASLPGMRERTITISSMGKTFSFTGWKIGWAFAPRPLAAKIQSAHQFVTFATSTPVQVGLARTLRALDPSFYLRLRDEYRARRDFLLSVLEQAGFEVSRPQGTYFVLARFDRLFEGDDRAFARYLTQTHKVAVIPPSVFFERDPGEGRRLIRFAFCKRDSTLRAAAERLGALRPAT
jgi:N-succinyldiaminopimelate aminotransferase